jgi:hypothetical protein
MSSDANTAALFAAAGAGGQQATDCAATWRSIRDRVARRNAQTATTLDGAVARLQSAVSTRDPVGSTAASATITATAADYARQFP